MASVEIWNGTWDEQDESALRHWDELLQKGKKITAIGSSDSHQRPEEPSDYPINLALGEPTVFVGAKDLTRESLFEAIKNGNVFVAENSRRSIEFTAKEFVGNSEKTIGDTLSFYFGKEVNFKFSLNGFPNGSKVKLISAGKIVKEFNTNNQKFSGEYPIISEKDYYVRLEVRNSKGKMLAFTNPIYASPGIID
jgi:hypothetical protein